MRLLQVRLVNLRSTDLLGRTLQKAASSIEAASPPRSPLVDSMLSTAAALSASAIPPASWSSLPSDVLVEAFKFIPVRPRLLVLGRVCRRWRHAAVASVEALPDELTPRLDSTAIALFVNLREVHITAPSKADESLLSPERCAKLRSLTISNAGTLPPGIAHCTALQRFSLTAAAPCDKGELVASLCRNAASITSLTLNTAAPWADGSAQPTLRALRTLDLSAVPQRGTDRRGLLTCVLLHSPTLTSLSVRVGDPEWFCALSLPRLTALNAGVDSMTHDAVTWLLSQPSLTALDFGSFYFGREVEAKLVAHLAPRLVQLHTASHWAVRQKGEKEAEEEAKRTWRLCTRLTSVTVPLHWRASAWVMLATQLTSLVLTTDPMEDEAWSQVRVHCTALTSLNVADGFPATRLHAWHLPRLRTLRSYCQTYGWVAEVVGLFPSLEEIRIGALSPPESPDFFPALQAAERRGLRLLCVRYGQTFLTAHAAEVHALQWLHFTRCDKSWIN